MVPDGNDFTNLVVNGKIQGDENRRPCNRSNDPQDRLWCRKICRRVGAMGFDIVLIAVIVGGIALSAAYVRAEYLGWREHGAAERRREASLGELHPASLSDQHHPLLLPTVGKLQAFGSREAAHPDSAPQI